MTFYYRKDALGNIVAIVDNLGYPVVKYTYDARGICNCCWRSFDCFKLWTIIFSCNRFF